MPTLAELINRDNITATWFWKRSVSTGPYEEYEVFDVVFARDGRPSVTGIPERPTLYVRDIGGSIADSMRNHGGDQLAPDPIETLGNVLSDVAAIDNTSGFEEWAEETGRNTSVPEQKPGIPEHDPLKVAQHAFGRSTQARKDYDILTRQLADVMEWLGNRYPEYADADRNY